MGIFSDIGDLFSGVSGGDLIQVGADLVGGLIKADSIGDAVDASKAASRDQIRYLEESRDLAIQKFEEARDRGLADLDAGTLAALRSLGLGETEARAMYRDLLSTTQPGVDYLSRVVASDPSRLTQAQQIGLEDLNREIDAHLASSGLRGAGRAGQAIKADQNRRYIAESIERNENRRDAASRALAPSNLSARAGEIALTTDAATRRAALEEAQGVNRANTQTGAGARSGSALTGLADNASAALGNIGEVKAGGELASGETWSRTIGDIASIFADDEKKGREGTAALEPVRR